MPHAHPATPTPTTNNKTPTPPLAMTVAIHSFNTGMTNVYTPTANSVHATPAKKLFRCVPRLGRYRNPEPAECGGMMKMS